MCVVCVWQGSIGPVEKKKKKIFSFCKYVQVQVQVQSGGVPRMATWWSMRKENGGLNYILGVCALTYVP